MILKPSAGSKRWQHYVRGDQAAAHLGNLHTENNYTIILGSHRNSCLKIEKELAGPYHQVHIFMHSCTAQSAMSVPTLLAIRLVSWSRLSGFLAQGFQATASLDSGSTTTKAPSQLASESLVRRAVITAGQIQILLLTSSTLASVHGTNTSDTDTFTSIQLSACNQHSSRLSFRKRHMYSMEPLHCGSYVETA